MQKSPVLRQSSTPQQATGYELRPPSCWLSPAYAPRGGELIPERFNKEPRAKSARYSPTRRQVIVELTNGCSFIFPVDKAQGLADASNKDLAAVKILGKGMGLHWEKLDADLSIASLVLGIFGSHAWMREIARRGGAATSPAKSAAARANGAKGGRPRKNSASQKTA